LLVTISVLLVEDLQLVREAIRDAFAKEPDIEVVAEAGSAREAFEQIGNQAPDVIVVDTSLPDLSGIETVVKLKAMGASGIVVLSDGCPVAEILTAGATALVTKSSPRGELIRAIRAAAEGQTYICPELAGALVSAVRDDEAPRLSRREREVVRLIAEGSRSPVIAEQLNIALGTVEVHRRNIMRKTGVRTVAELTRYAIREGLAKL
jgi:two-component system NarL family response regulator